MTHIKVMISGLKQLREMKLDSDSLIYHQQRFHPKQMSYEPPVTGTIYGVLLNDRQQVKDMDAEFHQAPYQKPPENPVMYIKPINTLNGHHKSIPMPSGETVVQIGASLGMVIGKPATNVGIDDALDYVAGYTIVNDVSIPHHDFHRPNIKNKVRDGFCPVGPWIVDPAAIPNPDDVTIHVYVNGEIKQEIHTKNGVRHAAQLLSEVSAFMTLNKGDVLLLGVFGGAPHAHIGDTVKIEISQIGRLENMIVSEAEWIPGGNIL